MLFRKLTPAEIETFQLWAQIHYIPGDEISTIWHPVVQAECHRINAQALDLINDKISDTIVTP